MKSGEQREESKGEEKKKTRKGEKTVRRISRVLARLPRRSCGVVEVPAPYNSAVDCDYEHRCAEHDVQDRKYKKLKV